MLATVIFFLVDISFSVASNLTSPKRGLVYTWSDGDNEIWTSKGSDLTWYYNYASQPAGGIDDRLQFVPMLWGAGSEYDDFYTTVTGLLNSRTDIEYILGFNEPDLCTFESAGGSCVDASIAAHMWQQQMEPLKQHGVQLGAPATTQGGLWWLQDFFTACHGKCSVDFLPIHYYGDFAGFAGYIGLMHETYPSMPLWVTEFAFPNATVLVSQGFYNQSAAYLDSLPYVDRYAYFGSFPSDDASSWVGGNGSMLNDAGELTDIGAWYLGENATGRAPNSAATSNERASWLFLAMLGMLLIAVQ